MPRNSSGTYTLPAGNPVAPNTIIETAWANPTMSDLGAAITDSLDRFGRGSMLAPIKVPDGAFNAPTYAFSSEATMGIFRVSSNVLGIAMAGLVALTISPTAATFNAAVHPVWAADPVSGDDLVRKSYLAGQVGLYLPLTGGALTGPGNLTIAGTLGVTGVTTLTTLLASSANVSGNAAIAGLISAGLGAVGTPSYTFAGDLNTGMWSPGADQTAFSGGGFVRLIIDANGTVRTGNGFRVDGSSSNAAGVGVEVHWLGGNGVIQAYSRTATAYQPMVVDGSTVSLGISGTPKVIVSAAGLVGIGGNSAGGNLEVIQAGGDPYIRLTNGTVQGYMQANGSTGVLPFGTLSNHPLVVFVNSAERARFPASGNMDFIVGGTANPFSTGSRGNVTVNGATSAIFGLSVAGAAAGYVFHDGTKLTLLNATATGDVEIAANSATFFRVKATTGAVSAYNSGTATLVEIGWRDLIQAATTWASPPAYRGQLVAITAGFTINTADAVPANSLITIFNNTTGNLTITQGAGMQLFKSGTAGAAGNRVIFPRGMMSLWYLTTTVVNCAGDCS